MTLNGTSKKWTYWKRTRVIIAWVALGAAVSLFLATWAIEPRYPTELARLGGPRASSWTVVWRVASLCVASVSIVLSFPRWQSIVALLGVIAYAFFFAGV